MSRRSFGWVLATLGAVAVCPQARALDLGDPAPPLTISEWVQGDAVDLSRGKGKMVYLVEFWAVWCPPCKVSIPRLTALQKKYQKDLVIIGVTVPDDRGNNPAAIKKFCQSQGKSMDYTVAIDKHQATSNAYMRAANAMGIPFAFLVDRKGLIAWIGSPLDPALDDVIDRVVAGTYDVRRARIETEVQARLDMVVRAAQMGQPELARDGLFDILKIDPGNELALDFVTSLYIDQLRDREGLRDWISTHIAEHGDDATVMAHLAEALCRINDLTMRAPDLALEAAGRAYEASKKSDPLAIAVYARAFFEIGALDRAIKLQSDAVANANGSDDQAKQLQVVLAHYNECKKLQATPN
ncbi:MAG: redoxin family protein [Phycisphaerae bacterium]